MKRPLRELRRGDVFRTADGRLWWLYAHGQPPYGRSWAGGVGRDEDTFPLPSDESVEFLDLPALLSRVADLERENDFLRGQLSDLWQDRTGAAVGAEAERGAVLGLIGGIRDRLPCADASDDEDTGMQAVLNVLWRNVQARGPCRPPVPPHRLEGALREVLALLEGARITVPNGIEAIAYRHAQVAEALARVREALGEGG